MAQIACPPRRRNPMEQRKILGLALRLLAVAAIVYVVYVAFGALFPKDTWPPRDEKDEEKIIAGYKDKLSMPDNPFNSRKPEDVPVYLSRIIDHDIKKGNLKSARDYVAQAIGQKVDGQVESLASSAETKGLIGKIRSALQKRDELNGLVALYDKGPRADAPQDAKEKFDREFKDLADQFCRTPFDAAACPEQAEEIARTYKAKLQPAGKDPRLKDVSADIEKNCLPVGK
jgi:hypothetical protein